MDRSIGKQIFVLRNDERIFMPFHAQMVINGLLWSRAMYNFLRQLIEISVNNKFCTHTTKSDSTNTIKYLLPYPSLTPWKLSIPYLELSHPSYADRHAKQGTTRRLVVWEFYLPWLICQSSFDGVWSNLLLIILLLRQTCGWALEFSGTGIFASMVGYSG